MSPAALAQVLRPLAGVFGAEEYPNLLKGLASPDDAAVWKLDDERAIVVSADFFPPLVDDPYAFGQIAAANAFSDLFAMGADPLLGLNLVGFPKDLDTEILSEILRGGADKAREAGAVVAGGHTVNDKEPKYGMAVVGLVHPDRILTKEGARPGDVLYLTKPLGSGVIATAIKKGEPDPRHVDAATASMARLNLGAARLLREAGDAVHAVTDITGFGLGGHAFEMASPSGVTFALDFDALPLLDGVRKYLAEGFSTGGMRRNLEFYGEHATLDSLGEEWQRTIVFDPQTSGGLLAAVDPASAEAVEEAFRDAAEPCWRVGMVRKIKEKSLIVR